jgi:hypothetical protein
MSERGRHGKRRGMLVLGQGDDLLKVVTQTQRKKPRAA